MKRKYKRFFRDVRHYKCISVNLFSLEAIDKMCPSQHIEDSVKLCFTVHGIQIPFLPNI